jgi:hypothetical protein
MFYFVRPSELSISYEQNGLFGVFLVNSILFNSMYIVYACLNYNVSNIALSESVGVLLHYFFIASFGLILAMVIFRVQQIYKPISIPLSYTLVSCLVVYCKHFKLFGVQKIDKKIRVKIASCFFSNSDWVLKK